MSRLEEVVSCVEKSGESNNSREKSYELTSIIDFYMELDIIVWIQTRLHSPLRGH